MSWKWPNTAETCRHHQTNKLRSLDSCVLTDSPTLICIKHNGDDKPEECKVCSKLYIIEYTVVFLTKQFLSYYYNTTGWLLSSFYTFYVHFFPKNRSVYEVMWKYMVEPGRPQMTTWRMHIACWIPEAINTHPEYETLITFPLQRR